MSLLAKIASLRQVNINAHAEIETLKLSLADRDEEVKSLRHCLQRSTDALKDEIKTLHAQNKALKLSLADKIHTKMNDEVVIMCRKEINTLKVQLADGDRSTLSTHEHHRELRDKLNAEIETLKLYADRRRAEIKTLKKDFDEFDWRGGSLKVEIDCLTQCLGERDEEIKTLKDVLANYATAKVVRGMGVVFKRKKVAETEE